MESHTNRLHRTIYISQWIKDEFSKAGINTNIYTAHSCKEASTSKERDNGVSLKLYRENVGKAKTPFEHFTQKI